MTTQNRVLIGKITRTHGIKGELRLLPYYSDIDFISKVPTIYFTKNNQPETKHKLTSSRPHSKYILIKIDDYNNINEVLEFANSEVSIDMEYFPDLDEDEHFTNELIGLKVYDEDNNYLGILDDIMSSKGHDIYQIINDNDEEILLPAVKEYILNIDLDAEIITVKSPKYL